jgi:hypothetical protein
LKTTTVFEENRRFILKAVWKSIKTMSSLKSFMACCEVWVEFAALYFTTAQVAFILEAIVEKLTPERVGLLFFLEIKDEF